MWFVPKPPAKLATQLMAHFGRSWRTATLCLLAPLQLFLVRRHRASLHGRKHKFHSDVLCKSSDLLGGLRLSFGLRYGPILQQRSKKIFASNSTGTIFLNA